MSLDKGKPLDSTIRRKAEKVWHLPPGKTERDVRVFFPHFLRRHLVH